DRPPGSPRRGWAVDIRQGSQGPATRCGDAGRVALEAAVSARHRAAVGDRPGGRARLRSGAVYTLTSPGDGRKAILGSPRGVRTRFTPLDCPKSVWAAGTRRGKAVSDRGTIDGGQWSGRPWVGVVANAQSGLGGGRRRVEALVRQLGRMGLEAR